MSTVFSPKSKQTFAVIGFGLAGVLVLAVLAIWYYATPEYTRVGYTPVQPVQFSHALHAGQLGMDCTYCHNHVGESPHSNIPDTQTCMNCHGAQWGNIKSAAASLAPLREAYEAGNAMPWVRVHKVPDYTYFNHAVHVARGVSCKECHGDVHEMDEVRHDKSHSMAWCLECHRNPADALRPADQVTNLDWKPDDYASDRFRDLAAFRKYMIEDVGVRAPESCSGCHR